MTSSPTQFSFYGNDFNLQLEMTSPPTQHSFYGNDVIAYVIPLKVLEISSKNFQPIRTKKFLDITMDPKIGTKNWIQNRVLRLSKRLFMESYSIKEFIFDPHIAYQSYKLTAELHMTRKENLFILENLKLIKKSYDNVSKTLFIPCPTPKFVKTLQQSSLFLRFLKILKV